MKGLTFPKKAPRQKIWTTTKCDAVLRDMVRRRDKICQWCRPCRGGQLQISHFWSRRYYAVRWDVDNVDLVCARAHWEIEHQKQGSYRDWKVKQLGEERYLALRNRMATPMKAVAARLAFQEASA